MVGYYILLSLAIVVPAIAYFKKALTLPASLCAIMMVLVAAVAGDGYALFLLLSFGLISVVDHVCKKRVASVNDNFVQKTGTRDIVQVIVNGGVATLSIVLWYVSHNSIFLLCFTASLIESFGDSAASDIGVACGQQAYDICKFRKINNGLSGGVTVAGTLGCFVSCLLISTLAFCLQLIKTIPDICMLILAAFLGCIADSVMGSLLQRKEKCDVCGLITEKKIHCSNPTSYYSGVKWINNDVVNLFCNIISALLIALFVSGRRLL